MVLTNIRDDDKGGEIEVFAKQMDHRRDLETDGREI